MGWGRRGSLEEIWVNPQSLLDSDLGRVYGFSQGSVCFLPNAFTVGVMV